MLCLHNFWLSLTQFILHFYFHSLSCLNLFSSRFMFNVCLYVSVYMLTLTLLFYCSLSKSICFYSFLCLSLSLFVKKDLWLGRLTRKYFGTLSSESIDSKNDGRPEKVIRTNKKVFNKNGVLFFFGFLLKCYSFVCRWKWNSLRRKEPFGKKVTRSRTWKPVHTFCLNLNHRWRYCFIFIIKLEVQFLI